MLLKHLSKFKPFKKSKYCTCCVKLKPRNPKFYFRDKTRHDGLRSECKKCTMKLRAKQQVARKTARSIQKVKVNNI
jgi:hypothetical protein